MKIRIFIMFIYFSFYINQIAQNQTSIFDSNWLKTIVSIEIKTNGSYSPIVTGFLIATSFKHMALITAKHIVLENNKIRDNIYYRLNELTNNSLIVKADYPSKYEINGGWFISGNYDIACRFVRYLETSDISFIDSINILPSKFLTPAANVLVAGFPLGIRSEKYSVPIVRKGIIAKSDSNNIIVDAFVFPGNSGGPVIYIPPLKFGEGFKHGFINEERLIGLVSSYIPYNDIAISTQTNRPRIIFEENTGLCNVVPVEAILEILNRNDFKQVDSKMHLYR